MAQPVAAVEVMGAGASAAGTIYNKWADGWQKNGGHSLRYETMGPVKMVEAVRGGKIDFGVTDAPPSSAELNKIGLVAFPTVISGLVPVVNLPGVKGGQLRLNADVLARIMSGKVTDWADPAILALNENSHLTSRAIKVIVRGDNSGSTQHLTHYLSATSPEWKSNFGTGYTVKWMAGATAVKGSAEMAAAVKSTEGAIGYVDFGIALEQGLTDVRMENAAGKFVRATPNAFVEAMQNSTWPSRGDFDEKLTNMRGSGSWPIAMAMFAVMPKVAENVPRTSAAVQLFIRGFVSGDRAANSSSYASLPVAVQGKATNTMASIRDKSGQPLPVSFF
ncbi:phosphate transport system substrate-binding protein [Chitinivorax tropicus]|uniref:Phosphate-binding protein PstS n=1 Tax=Chitinivorax tropicus TaxID=714531 RepID=A0A840MT20_9PROT|nr:phosphate ABC transporter substrate-binding protein PstS [Chitinivorax tropicus]MBB5019546.1 phosphate transport system substrate-binding protein [Chitinivorax tropicus]